jgi:hypothetical protein
MGMIPEKAVADWAELRTLAESFDVTSGFTRAYIFRGHADAAWTLNTSLHRSASNGGKRPLPTTETLLQLEGALAGRFKEEAPTFLNAATLQSTHALVDWWTIMRHFGAPTRILDWTFSFYVATYFACSSNSHKDGTIYVLHLHTLDKSVASKFGEAGSFSPANVDAKVKSAASPHAIHIVGRATALLDRMVSQQCCFMSSLNVSTDLEEELSTLPSHVPVTGTTLGKVRISANLKPAIMHRLRAMNITAASLFPGLDGIGRSLDEIVRYP